MSRVAVIGYGYVGSSIAKPIADSGHSLIVVDTDPDVVSEYPKYTTYSVLSDTDIALICVPTPLSDDGLPNTSIATDAIIKASKYMPEDSVIIIESTVPITFTKHIEKIVTQRVAFSAERIDPGNPVWNVSNTAKVVAANDTKTLIEASKFYRTFVKDVYPTNNTDEAEAAKLLENAYRLVNISFINEFAILMDRLGINANNVIDFASTKPYGFQAFRPGIGAGGHCIPVDPMFLMRHGINMPVLSAAKDINTDINIDYYIDHLAAGLKTISGKRILVVGIAYKKNSSDIRESASIRLIERLKRMGANVRWHDHVVKEYNNERSVKDFSGFDAAIITQRHDGFDDSKLSDIGIIVDCERKI